VPEWVLRAARLAPDSWIQLVDPAWPTDLIPPVYAIAGAWRSDVDGEVVEFEANPDYRPSPRAQGLPAPTDSLDAAVQAGASGYGPPDAVLDELMEATVTVPTLAPDGPLRTGNDPAGQPVLAVYSASRQFQAFEIGPCRVLAGRELADVLPEGHDILINPGAVLAARIPGSALRDRSVR
jgi:hypothetical protein